MRNRIAKARNMSECLRIWGISEAFGSMLYSLHFLKNLFLKIILFISMDVLPAWISLYHMCAWCLQRPKEVLGPGSGGIHL